MDTRLQSGFSTGGRHFRVESVQSFEHFRQLGEPWKALVDAALDSFPMVTHEWLSAWWTTFAAGRPALVILVWEGRELVGAAPFLYDREKSLLGHRLVLRPWVNTWVDRFTLLVVEPAQEIVDAILEQALAVPWDILELPRLATDSPVAGCIRRSLERKSLAYGVEDDLQSPFLTLPDSWGQLLSQLSPSFRQNLRRKMRSAEKHAELDFQILEGEECIAPIVEVSLESWQHDCGTAIASRPEVLEFYSTLIRAYAARGGVRCALMKISGEPAAFELNLLHRGTLHNLKLGFKKKFACVSTGVVLKAYLMQTLLADKERRPVPRAYDFMGIAEPYKLQWSKQVRAHERYRVFAKRPAPTALYWLRYVAKPFARERFPTTYKFAKRCACAIHGNQNRPSADGS